MRAVYLDHAATTPMHPAAIEAMTDVLATVGNASSLHTAGRTARRRMEEARETLAGLLGARPSEVIFTAGGTESDNLAVKGIFWARRDSVPLLHGVWAASVLLCGWGLVTRVVPDRFGVVDPISGYRLSEPIGYWNSLGLLAAIGALLGLGLSARAVTTLGRAAGAASVPPFVATLHFTFSRGAWVALAAGLAAAVAVDRRRLQLLVTLAAAGGWSAAILM